MDRFSGQRCEPLPPTSELAGVVIAEPTAAAVEEVATSWARSANDYRVDAASPRAPCILTAPEIRERQEPQADLIHLARLEVDALYDVVGPAGYAVLFCSTDGVAIDHRGDERLADDFKYWGAWLGGVWSEEIEGTNGIGTCLTEGRPVTVHRGQHFRSRNKNLSCSGAPVFGFNGEISAVIDVSAIDPSLSEHAHALTGSLTENVSRDIEERLFRAQFKISTVLAFAAPEDRAQRLLLAVDADHRIVGANRAARQIFELGDSELELGISLWSRFGRDRTLFMARNGSDVTGRLLRLTDEEFWPVLVTPALSSRSPVANETGLVAHTRPRSELLQFLRQTPVPPARKGGLSDGALRRVQAYVEENLGSAIDLASMAAIAGVSLYHFARQFRQSTGITPHQYVIRRRVERGRELLSETDMALSDIALATGFADQGHFARLFRRTQGVTPRAYRWSQR